MRHHNFFTRSLSVILLALIPTLAFADLTKDFVDGFNAMNGNQGLKYTSDGAESYAKKFNVTGGYMYVGEGQINIQGPPPVLSAYSAKTSSSNTFRTFCIEPEATTYIGNTYYGLLNYENNSTTTSPPPSRTLNVGVAWLYKEFAAGILGVDTQYAYNYETGRANSAFELQLAIWFLLGVTTNELQQNLPTAVPFADKWGWESNSFLKLLLQKGDKAFWEEIYNPGGYYQIMGDVQVFAMRSAGAQDILFATTGAGNGVPEPTSLLLWTLGSLGAAGMAHRKRRKAKSEQQS